MNQPTPCSSKRSIPLQQGLILFLLLCWSQTGLAQTQSDLLIVIDDDGIGYTAQQTLFADDDLIVVKLPSGRQTLQTVFAGSGSALYKRAHDNEPDKLILVSGSVFTRFRHRFSKQEKASELDVSASQALQLSATMAQYETTMASTVALSYRVIWILPPSLELLSYSTDQDAQADGTGNWTLDDNRITFEQSGGVPTQMTINYLVQQRESPSRKNACLASVGPSEWCSPDIDLDRVPDYRDLCIPVMDTDQQPESADPPITLTDTSASDEQPLETLTGSPSLVPEDSLGCPDNTLIVLPDIQFESGQTYLNAKSRVALDKVAIALQRMPDDLFRIATHTDNAGYVNNNQLLSENRADAIRHYLMLRGVSPNQIQARGYGETSPAHDNRTAAGRRANRRVELRQLD